MPNWKDKLAEFPEETSFQKDNSYTAYLRLTKAAMTFQVLP